ncbi:tail protein X [Methylobacterium sp. WL120]|uniref:tail protein X n=1 Tax=Methylobacterium sp. WL120 TaxID=2603887 RepID=UPI0011CBD473|nr:tail protein X [Methylobacterium sp. WL120]TXM68303.1 phage tail protein [Methylobacterium sp. WL120]
MAKYITKMFDRLDKICEKRYGDTSNKIVEYVMEQNPGLEDHGIVLPAGLIVFMPDRPRDKADPTPVITQIRLWN